jgi:tRNA modification GTPase
MFEDTITALSTPNGVGAISLIRISGLQTFSIVDRVCKLNNNKKLKYLPTNTIHLGVIIDTKNQLVDKVLVYIYRSPYSYTGEDIIEISCHGSLYIVNTILQLLVNQGARIAKPGEFTLRAFLNGKIDLSQAEAVANLISSESDVEHRIAINQMKGIISNKINLICKKLLNLYSYIEINISFSDELVIEKSNISKVIEEIEKDIEDLINSFNRGNSIKKGIAVAIVVAPNVGKSTLLNTILQENRAIVSDIPGTTRDIIEDYAIINGIRFRFIDTAGIRETSNKIEILGIEKTFEYIQKSNIIFYLFDSTNFKKEKIINQINKLINNYPDKRLFILANKSDIAENIHFKERLPGYFINISAKKKKGIDKLINLLCYPILQDISNNQLILTQVRHYEIFKKVLNYVKKIHKGMNTGISEDLLYLDIKKVFIYLEEITGKRHSEELLNNIFSNFCIGK